MDSNLFTRLLCRFGKAEIPDAIRKWGYLPANSDVFRDMNDDHVWKHKTRRAIIDDIVREARFNRVGQVAVDEMDLFYVQKHSKKRTWSVYQVGRAEGLNHRSSPPNIFRNEIRNQLQNYFVSHVSILPKDGVYWLRISLREGGRRTVDTVCYVVYHPQADYLIVSGLLKSVAKFVFQAFVTVMNGTTIKDIKLDGKCVKSLAELSIGSAHQGAYSKLAYNQADGTALTSKGKKRKRSEEDEDSQYFLKVFNENLDDKRRRQADMEEIFGTNRLPTLEKVTFQCQTGFGGIQHAPGMAAYSNEVFRCAVKFEGPSVLEGLRAMGNAGLADLPMKAHVASIQNKAMNKFVIRNRPQIV